MTNPASDPPVCIHCGAEVRAETRICAACRRLVDSHVLGRYQVVESIGRGGVGQVYRAEHPDLGTSVALKIVALPDEQVAGADGQTATLRATSARERFLREARLTAGVPHPGVARVLDVEAPEVAESAGLGVSSLYLVLEYVPGRTLRQVVEEDGPLPVARAVEIAALVCDVLAAAHDAGVVHRDVKPENVVLESGSDVEPRVRLLDFGIARSVGDEVRLTRTGDLVGTPEYMAPEQVLDDPDDVGPAADVHAVGLLLHEMLTGRSPFRGGTLLQVLRNVELLEPAPVSSERSDVAPALTSLVLQALEKEPSARPGSARDLARGLRSTAGGDGRRATPVGRGPVSRPRRSILLGLSVVALTFAVIGGVLLDRALRRGADRRREDSAAVVEKRPPSTRTLALAVRDVGPAGGRAALLEGIARRWPGSEEEAVVVAQAAMLLGDGGRAAEVLAEFEGSSSGAQATIVRVILSSAASCWSQAACWLPRRGPRAMGLPPDDPEFAVLAGLASALESLDARRVAPARAAAAALELRGVRAIERALLQWHGLCAGRCARRGRASGG